MQLHEWQRQLQASILSGSDQLRTPLDQGRISRERQIGVYADAYFLRLAEALQCNYPMLHQLLGDDDFTALAQQYVAAHPSTHPSIRWFGAAMADLLISQAPYESVPILAELAQFEWALRHSVDAADAERLDLARVQQIPQLPRYVFALHPSVTLLALQCNAPQVWQALSDGETPPAPHTTPMTWLVWRQADLSCSWRSVEASEAQALEAINRGADFAGVCDAMQDGQSTDLPLLAAQYLQTWLAQGLLVQTEPQS